jgi:hypothetical protein
MNVGSSAAISGIARKVWMPSTKASKAATPGSSALDQDPARTAPPNAQNPRQLPREYLELYHAVEAQRADDRAIVVQFVGALGGEGTTTVASGFARRRDRDRRARGPLP